MDSWTLNKVAGAVLGTCVVGMGIGLVAQGIYESGTPAKPGYALPEPKEAAGGGGEKKPDVTPIAVRLEKADPKKGEADAKVCSACHNFQEGAGAKVGPDLWDVVDRPKGKAEGFDYSAGMKAKGGNWTYDDLDTFLLKPSAYVQGTKMGYPGQEDPEKRADIIAYLRTLAKEPKPLPKVTEADKKGAAGAEAKGAAKGGDGESTAKAGGEAEGQAAFLKLVGSSDPKKGQAAAQVCSACHSLKKGGGTLIGPDLWDVVNRKKGSVAGFDYSEGLKKKGGDWTFADLDAWLTKPAAYIPGTKMGYPGEANEKKRAEIIAFLRTLSDKPVALPDTKEGEKKAEAPHEGSAKTMPPDAKPNDQKPPPPPPKPDAGKAPPPPPPAPPAPPAKPDDAKAPPAPPAPPPPAPPKPDAGKAPPPPAPPAPPPAPAKADASEAAPTTGGEGPEPYTAADPQAAPQGEPQTLPKMTTSEPSLTPNGDKTTGDAAGPEPYSAASPSDSK